MGFQGRISHQPDYLELLKSRAYYKALIKKLTIEKESYAKQVDSSQEVSKEGTIALKFLYALHFRINELKLHLEIKIEKPVQRMLDYYKNAKGSETVVLNIKLNMQKLADIEKEYIAKVNELPLVKFDEKNVTDWILDASQIQLKTYYPTSAITYNASRGFSSSSIPNKVVLDSVRVPVKFVYADGTNEEIRDRYVVYWQYANGGKDGQLIPASKEMMLPIGVGHTDLLGNLFQSFSLDKAKAGLAVYESKDKDNNIIHRLESLDYEKLNSVWHDKNDEFYVKYDSPLIYFNQNCMPVHYDRSSSLAKENAMKGLQEHNDKLQKSFDAKVQQRINLGKFDKIAEYGFFIYPMDHGRIRTIDLHKLTSMAVPNDSTAKAIAYKGMVPLNGPIALHCTLAEWDNRLKKAYDEANYSFQLIEIAQSVHRQQESKLDQMIAAVKAQMHFPYGEQSMDEFKIRKEMLTNLTNAKKIIHERYSTTFNTTHSRKSGSLAEKEAAYISAIKGEFKKKLEVLYKLITNKALKSEFELYNKIILEKIENKEVPSEGVWDKKSGKALDQHYSGPYMEYEPAWVNIVHTLSDCYAMLGHSEEIKEQIWNHDIKPAMDVMMNIKELDVVFQNWFSSIKELEDTDDAKELVEDLKSDKIYLKDQNNLLSESSITADPNASLCASVMSGFVKVLEMEQKFYGDTKMKDFLGNFIPTLGPPNIMQVMLNVYNAYSMAYLQKKNAASHIRITITYFYIARLIKFKAGGKIRNGKLNLSIQIYKQLLTVFVRGPQNNPAKHALSAKLKLLKFFKGIDIDSKYEAQFYEKKLTARGKLMMQGAFYVLNLGLLVQSFLHTKHNGKDEKSFEIVDAIAGAHAILTVGHTSASGVFLFTRTRAMWKGVPPDTIKLNVLSEKIGSHLGHAMMLTAAALSWMDMLKYSEEGDTSAEYKAWVNLRLNLIMFTGYALKAYTKKLLLTGAERVTTRFLLREAALFTVNAIPVLGQIAYVAASIVSFLWLLWDLLTLAWPWLEGKIYGSPQFDLFDNHWKHFTTPVNPGALDTILERYAKRKDLPPQLLISYASQKQLRYVYDFNPYLTYTSGKATDEDGKKLTASLKRVGQLRLKYTWFDDGVKWKKLSWRSVVPLYLAGVSVAAITKAVTFHDTFMHSSEMTFQPSILLKYYIYLRKIDNSYNKQELNNYYNFSCTELTAGTVAKLLEEGKFTMREGMKFPLDWKLDKGDSLYEKGSINSGTIRVDNYHYYIPEKFSFYGLENFPSYLASEVYKNETLGKKLDYFLDLNKQYLTSSSLRELLLAQPSDKTLKKLSDMDLKEYQKRTKQRLLNWRKVFCQSQHDLNMANKHGALLDTEKNGFIVEKWVNNERWMSMFDPIKFLDYRAEYIKNGELKKEAAKKALFDTDNSVDYIGHQFT